MNLTDNGSRVLRWVKGQHFPLGFDEWCELVEAPPDPMLPTHKVFSHYVSEHSKGDWGAAAESFFTSVTGPGKPWFHVEIDPSGDYIKHQLILRFPEEHRTRAISRETTHSWKLSISGIFKLLQCINARVGLCSLHPIGSTPHVRLVNCVIGKLEIRAKSSSYSGEITLELHDSWVGTLVLTPGSLKTFRVIRGSIAQIECPASDSENPFKGAVSFSKVFFPSSPTETRLFQGPQAYRSLYAHLKKLDNTLMANLMRSHQLRAERADEHGFAKLANWIYGTFANYGMSPGRPLWWLGCTYILAVIGCYNLDSGTLVQSVDAYVGAYSALLNENGGRWTRSTLLPLQSIINPIGAFFDPRRLVVSTTGWGSTLLTLQGLFSDILIVMTALSIRRRFKAD